MRLFISLPLSEKVIKNISEELDKIRPRLRGKNIRYIPPQNWHFTLIFLGEQDSSHLEIIKKSLLEASHEIDKTGVELNRIVLGPNNKNPRMIWATTNKKTSNKLGSMKKVIRRHLENAGVNWKKDSRPYKGHVTIARFKYKEVQPLPKIKEKVDLSYSANKVHLMESSLTPYGAKYKNIESYPLTKLK